MGWPLKTKRTISEKTVREMASWMTLSCIRLKGPPLPTKPMRLAGTVRQYSKKAMPQEKRMTQISGQLVEIFISCSLRCPYQAKVMKILEQTNIKTVQNACIVVFSFSGRKDNKPAARLAQKLVKK